jgi:dynein heavy chain
MAGSMKRAFPDLIEDAVLIKAMKDANVPKFLKEDLPLFYAIIGDLFPGIEVKENDYGILKTTLEKMAIERKMVAQPNFILKCIQLFETFNVRFGVMLVGQTGSAKTAVYEVLEDTMIYMRENDSKDKVYQMVKKIILNPKAISMNEMYGYVNSSQEWFDGLASKVMRLAAQETGDEKTWVVFDGPVDAIWIENMNTVLDDNMTLCLSNGQRIKLRKEMRMLFEVQDLLVASPATVSRCGMVYLTPEELGWRPFVRTWIDTFFDDEFVMPPKLKDHLWVTFDATIDIALEFIRNNCKEAIPTTDLQ